MKRIVVRLRRAGIRACVGGERVAYMALATNPRETRRHGRRLRRRESFGSSLSAPAGQGGLALPVSAQSIRLPPSAVRE